VTHELVDLGTGSRPRERRELNSVGNALCLLETLAPLPDAGISELSRAMDLAKPTVDRLLVTLVAAGFAEQDRRSRRYRLTHKLLGLADGVRARATLLEVARPYVIELAEQLAETINLGILSDSSVVYLETVASSEVFRVEPRPGTILPAYCTALGKAMLAHLPAERLDAVLAQTSFDRRTPNTITSEQALRDAVAAARRDGYATDNGEVSEDVHCIAVAILDANALALAAVSAAVPRTRFLERRELLIDELQRSAGRISRAARVLGTGSGR
jgi:IclR family KDG regulon transcriptional repressor